MQLIYLVLTGCGIAAALQDVNLNEEWLDFKQKFNKSYSGSLEENQNFSKFKKNLYIILEHNKLYQKGEVSFEIGLNPYTDMDIKDMEATSMGLKIESSNAMTNIFESSLQDIPDSMDWRTKGAVTPVKNQGPCGSCWAFSAIGALESRNFLKTNNLIELSEQNLVDCNMKNSGCSGGWTGKAYDYIRDNDGIDTESTYPYKGTRESCNFLEENVGATCSSYTAIAKGNESDLKDAIASLGPFSVSIGVTDNFKHYKSGVFNDNTCGDIMNHAVLAVGYGSKNGLDYWLVKNSWGSEWGDGGYIKMARNKNNQCSIASYALIPNV